MASPAALLEQVAPVRQPCEVLKYDLSKLSALAGCSQAALIEGLHDDSELDLAGALAPVAAQVSFQVRESGLPGRASRLALVSCASRPGSLDSAERPKHLLPLRGESIIRHVLRQLWQGGVDRVVLVLGWKGRAILEDLRQCASLAPLQLEVVDLGDEYRDGFARSLLAAASAMERWPEEMLVCTADHVFSAQILERIQQGSLAAEEAVRVLVELDPKLSQSGALPHTAVRVRVDASAAGAGQLVAIGQEVEPFDGVEAGLFLAQTEELFGALRTMAAQLPYFSLAHCLAGLCAQRRLRYVATGGLGWFGLETDLAIESVNQSGPRALFSGEMLTGRSSSITSLHDLDTQWGGVEVNLILGFTDHTSSQVNVLAPPSGQSLGGFMIGVAEKSQPPSPASSADVRQAISGLDPPLLPGELSASPDRAVLAPMQHQQQASDAGSGFVLSIPTSLTTADLDSGEPSQSADGYLIAVPDSGPPGSCNYVFAVPQLIEPDPETQPDTIAARISAFELPTDVTNVVIERSRARSDSVLKDGSSVQVMVSKSVPAVGWLMLAVALVTSSAIGPLVDLQTHCTALAKMLWRSTVAAGIFIVMGKVAEGRKPVYSQVISDRALLKLLGLAWVGWLIYFGGFQLAAGMTSITHTYLFGQMVSMFIVLHKLLTCQAVSKVELGGVAIAAAGAGLCLMDKGKGDHAPSIKGDMVALVSACGGCLFLTLAKGARAQVNTFVFYSIMHTGTALVLFIVGAVVLWQEGLSDSGVLGWVHPEPFSRLPLQLILFVVGDCIGLCGYIIAMKYFDPLLVSLVMLLEPIVGTAEGILLRVSTFPGMWSIGGAAAMFVGIALVSHGAQRTSTTVDASAALHQHDEHSNAATPKGQVKTDTADDHMHEQATVDDRLLPPMTGV